MTRSGVKLFGMETINDYLALCEEAVKAFEEEQDSVLKGFTAILALNHLPDWLRYKLTQADRQSLGFADPASGASVKCFFENQNEDLKLLRQIANGFKHLQPDHSTERIAGYGEGPWGIGPCGAPYLLIDPGTEKDASERSLGGLELCKRVLAWWKCILRSVISRGNG